MPSSKKSKQVIDDLLRDNSRAFDITSCQKFKGLSQKIKLFYSDSFVEYIKSRENNSRFLEEFAKFHTCATTYGYRGFSAKKNNGIVDIKPTDTKLLNDYIDLLTPEIIEKYELTDNLKPIKIVAHVPSGNRPIGVLDRAEKNGAHTIVILGMSNYTGKPK